MASEPFDRIGADREFDSAVRRANPEEWARLLEQFRPYLLSIAQAEFPQPLTARLGPSDLVQLTLVKGNLRANAFHGGSREELAGWLRQILLNQLHDAWRHSAGGKRKIQREVPVNTDLPDTGLPSPSAQALSREERERLDAAITRLPDEYRLVVVWRHCEDLPFLEIGRRLGRSEEAARKLWTRALKNLQRELGLDADR